MRCEMRIRDENQGTIQITWFGLCSGLTPTPGGELGGEVWFFAYASWRLQLFRQRAFQRPAAVGFLVFEKPSWSLAFSSSEKWSARSQQTQASARIDTTAVIWLALLIIASRGAARTSRDHHYQHYNHVWFQLFLRFSPYFHFSVFLYVVYLLK